MSRNWLRVLRSADTSPIAQGVRQQRHTKGEPLEKCEGFSRSTGVGMRLIAMFFGPHAPREQTAQSSVFSHYFKRLERLPKLATSSTVPRIRGEDEHTQSFDQGESEA